MNNNLQSYLFFQNLYSLFSMLISIIVIIGLAFYVHSYMAVVLGPGIFNLIVFAPFLIFGRDMIKDLKTYFREMETDVEPLSEPHLSRVKHLTEPILDRCQLNNHPISYLPIDDGDTEVAMMHHSAYIAIEDEVLDRPDDELQSVLAHEIIHILFSDGLRGILVYTLNVLLVIYSVIIAPILIISVTQIPWYLILIGLLVLVRFLTSWAPKISEVTADTGTTLLGYGPGLRNFFTYAPHKQEPFVWLFDNHESRAKRTSRISKVMKRLK